jgi:hypothetical protein
MVYNIKERRAIITISAILLLTLGVVLSISYIAFAQSDNTTTAQGSIQAAITNQSVQQSAVEETELDDENDRTVYSVKIVKGNQELEVKVDALTEEVMKVEQD